MPVRAVLFDLDDTIYDHTGASRRSTAEVIAHEPALAAAGLDAVQAENVRHLEVLHAEVAAGRMSIERARVERWRRVLVKFGADPGRAPWFSDRVRAAYLASEGAVPGAHDLLQRLRSAGLRLGIVSNNEGEEQRGKLRRLGLDELFSTVVVSAEHGVAKPDPRLFMAALDGLGVGASQAAHVGDSWPVDVVGARAAGIRPVWFNRFGRPAGDALPVRQIADFRRVDASVEAILAEGRER